jgi:PAS domain S-box-containing protein
MASQKNNGRRSGMHQTTLRFGPLLWQELEAAARTAGTSIAQFVREAAVARLAYTAGRDGDTRLEQALALAREASTYDDLESRVQELASDNKALGDENIALQATGAEDRSRANDMGELALLLEIALSSAGVAVVVLDAAGRVGTWNDASERLLGLRADEVQGRSFTELDAPAVTPALRETVRLALQSELPQTGMLESEGLSMPLRVLPLPPSDGAGRGAVLLIGETLGSSAPGNAEALPA